MLGFGTIALVAARWPQAWLTLLPAALPWLDFAPWTGWVAVGEFDLLVLAAIAAGHARLAWRDEPASRWPKPVTGIAALLALTLAIGIARGVLDATPSTSGWFQSYLDPLNTWRVAKSLAWTLLLLPLLLRALRDSADATYERIARGMLIGLALVAFAVLRERVAYPGWLDFTKPYRTVAWFWEMHVGGAAIDAYVALATPFAAWALWHATTPWRWSCAALLALLVLYAGLTTFSRGVYLAVGAPLAWLGLWLSHGHFGLDLRRWMLRVALALIAAALLAAVVAWIEDRYGLSGVIAALVLQVGVWLAWTASERTRRWRRGAGLALAATLLVEVVVVLGAGSFMLSRFASSEHDFDNRVAHWKSGIGLIATPVDGLIGIGIGRLPAHYVRTGPRHELSGSARYDPGPPPAVLLAGAPTSPRLTGLMRLTQRVPLATTGHYRATLVTHVDKPAVIGIAVCETHLIYARACQDNDIQLLPDGPARRDVVLEGDPLTRGPAWAPREAVLALAVLTPGVDVRLERISLQAPDGRELLANGDFAAGLAHWFPSAVYYYLPWHIDNLLLEVLIERGALGLVALGLLAGGAAWLPFSAGGRARTWAPFLAASLYGVLLVGLVSSVMDAPRVALLALLLACLGYTAAAGSGRPPTASPAAPA